MVMSTKMLEAIIQMPLSNSAWVVGVLLNPQSQEVIPRKVLLQASSSSGGSSAKTEVEDRLVTERVAPRIVIMIRHFLIKFFI